LFGTAEFTVERKCTNVKCVTRWLVSLIVKHSHESPHGRQIVQVFSVHCVIKVLVSPATCSDINVV